MKNGFKISEYDWSRIYVPYIPLHITPTGVIFMKPTHTEQLIKLINVLESLLLFKDESIGPQSRELIIEDIRYVETLIRKLKYDNKLSINEMRICNSLYKDRLGLLKRYTAK